MWCRRLSVEPELAEKQRQKIERLQQEASQLRDWLAANPKDRQGSKGSLRKSNRTDPDSAKMATSKGVNTGLHRGCCGRRQKPDHY